MHSAGIHAHGFADMYSILKAASCSSFGIAPWENYQGPCGSFIYGNLLLAFLVALKLPLSATPIIAIIINYFVLVIIVQLSNPMRGGLNSSFILLAALFSPGLNLLFERGNIDAEIFIMVILAIFAMVRGKRTLAFILIALSALLKFYTLPLIWLMYLLSRSKKSSHLLISIGTSIWVILEVMRIGHFAEPDVVQFGASIYGVYARYVGINLPSIYWVILGNLLTGIIVAVALSKKAKKYLQIEIEDIVPNVRMYVYIFCSIIFLICFAIGNNYDYRLIFFAGVALTFDSIFILRSKQKIVLLVIFTLGLLCSSLVFGKTLVQMGFKGIAAAIQLIGDLSLTIAAALVIYSLLQILMQRNHGGRKSWLIF